VIELPGGAAGTAVLAEAAIKVVQP